MDTSETYIKMCKKAEEIQKLCPSGTDFHDYFYCHVHGFGCDLDRAIWLPRQDQLQEMMGKYDLFQFWRKFFSYSDYVIQTDTGFEIPQWGLHCESYEQLWLALVMRDYGKVWNGEDWQEIKTIVGGK